MHDVLHLESGEINSAPFMSPQVRFPRGIELRDVTPSDFFCGCTGMNDRVVSDDNSTW